MLTKEDRATIAERLNSCEGNGFCKFYEAITNREAPELTTFVDDIKVMLPVILDLCDTSNMIELPRDKDGEVIHVGDMLYCGSGTAYKAKKIIHNGNDWEIQFFDDRLCISIYADPNDLTHKKPVTIKSLVKKLTDIVAADYGTPMVVKHKLSDIADKLESLGDSDD